MASISTSKSCRQVDFFQIYSIQSGLCQMELGASVAELGELLNTAIPAETPALEDIRAFCYSIQLSFFLAAGFVSIYLLYSFFGCLVHELQEVSPTTTSNRPTGFQEGK